MPYLIEQFTDAPIILYSSADGSNVAAEMGDFIREMLATLDEQREPVYQMIDFSNVKLSLDELIETANRTTRMEGNLLHHPNVRENVFITDSPIMRLALTGMAGETFGNVRLSVHGTREDAIAYCYQRIAEEQSS